MQNAVVPGFICAASVLGALARNGVFGHYKVVRDDRADNAVTSGILCERGPWSDTLTFKRAFAGDRHTSEKHTMFLPIRMVHTDSHGVTTVYDTN
jgi:hypothetical protein